jgi:RimJ/RimL family protein N-acetyltransferase
MEAPLETERLRLRPLDKSDAERITEFIGDFDVTRMLTRVPHPYTLKDAHEYLSGNAEREQRGVSFTRAIDQDGLIGVLALGDIRAIEGEKIAEFGYWLAKPYWGKGLMTEAGRAFLRHAFEEGGIFGLKSGHFAENYRSGRVLTKLGFRYAGSAPKHCLARGEDVDCVDVVLTRAQWREFMARRRPQTLRRERVSCSA